MRIKINADGRVLEGTAKQIVEAMQYVAFGQQDRTLTEYIDWAAEMASRMNEVDLRITGSTDEERAESLVRGMLETGLAERL